MASKTKLKPGMGCLVLFALPFAGVGIFMTVLVARSLLLWHETKAWIPTPATIVEAELETHRGDDSTTYKATARYTYEFGSRQYESTHVALHGGSDNIGDFHQRLARELKRHKQSGKPYTCYVDPTDPAEAILNRDLRPGMLTLYAVFALVFGGVGFGMLVGGAYGLRKQKEVAAKKTQTPEEPWLWREDWASGTVRPSNRRGTFFLAAFTAFWNLFCWPIFFIFLFDEQEKDSWTWLIAIFPLVGIGLLLVTLYMLIGLRRWGGSSFEMASVPGVVGGSLAGVVHVPGGLQPTDGFQITLSAIEEVTERRGDKSETRDVVRWQDSKTILRDLYEADPTRTAIPVQFYIPYDAPETDDEKDLSWQLEAKASVPGVDYHSTFEVPVFKTADSSPDAVPADDALAEYEAPVTLDTAVERSGGVVERQTPNDFCIVFPMARHPGVASAVTVVAAIFIAAWITTISLQASLFFNIIFGFFTLLIAWVTLDLWLDKRTIEVWTHALSVRGGFLGLGRQRLFPREKIRRIRVKSGMQSGSKLYYQIQLHDTAGKTHTLAKRLPGKSDAELIAEQIRSHLEIE